MNCVLRVREGLGMQVSVALPVIGRLIRRDIRMTVRDTLGRCRGARETTSQGTKAAELDSRRRRRGPFFKAPSHIHGATAAPCLYPSNWRGDLFAVRGQG